ncbi:MAG: hypothetical protein ACF8NJ_04430 [Phycisphaerales bacterium JB038]
MPILAQLVPQLDPPAALGHFTLENPWPVGVLALAAALIALYLLSQLGKARQGLLTAIVLVVVAAAVFTLAPRVETSREAVMQRSGRLVDAAAVGEEATVADLLSEEVRLRVADNPLSLGRDTILALVRRVGRDRLIASHSVNDTRAGRAQPTRLTSQVQVSAVAAGGGGAMPTWWQLEWKRSEDGAWRVEEIIWLTLGPNRPSAALLAGR